MNSVWSNDEIFRQLVKIIADALRIDPDTISLESNLVKDFDAESIDLVDIRFRIEETFGFKEDHEEFIEGVGEGEDPQEIAEHITVERIVAYVANRLAKEEQG